MHAGEARKPFKKRVARFLGRPYPMASVGPVP
jgi:hypothetical protein